MWGSKFAISYIYKASGLYNSLYYRSRDQIVYNRLIRLCRMDNMWSWLSCVTATLLGLLDRANKHPQAIDSLLR